MTQLILKLQGSSGLNNRKTALTLAVFEKTDGKEGYPAVFTHQVDGKYLPRRHGRLFLNGDAKDPSKLFMTFSGAVNQLDADGNIVTQPRKNGAGQFVNYKNEVVPSEDKADRSAVYAKDAKDELILATFASLNIKNLNAEKQPTKQTQVVVKLFSDEEAKNIEREIRKLKAVKAKGVDADIEAQASLVKEMQKNGGEYITMFIQAGAETLKAFGFPEVRVPAAEGKDNAQEQAAVPAQADKPVATDVPGFDDSDIPF